MNKEEAKYDEVLPIYRNIANAANVLVENVIELSKLNLVDEDIQRINQLDLEASEELFLLSSEINDFKDHTEEILNGII